MRSRYDGTRLIRTRAGHWQLVRADGSVAWGSEPSFGDEADWPDKPGPERDALILGAVRNGAAKFSFANVTSSVNGHTATFRIFGDALQVPFEASPTGLVRVSVSAALQQTIADLLDCSLLTAKLADLLFAQRTVTLPPHTQVPDATMVTTRVMAAQSAWLDAQLTGADTTIVQTAGKHWIVDNLMLSKAAGTARDGRPKAINYGWHMTSPTFQGSSWPRAVTLPDVFTVQNRGWAHSLGEADYSQNCVLVSNACVIDGQPMRLQDVLQDPELAPLANADGVLHVLRQPGVPPVAPIGAVASMAGERMRRLRRLFGDDSDGGLGGLGGLGDSLSSGASSLSSAASGLSSQASSALGDISSQAQGISSQASGALSSLSSASSSLSQATQGLQGLSGQAQSAISSASSVASQASQAIGDASNMTPAQALSAGLNILATSGAVTGAAGGLLKSAAKGDWNGAAMQSLALLQNAAADPSKAYLESSLIGGAKGAAAGAAAGASIGSVVPGIGNVIGGVVGAVAGWCAGLVQTFEAGVQDPAPYMAVANDYATQVKSGNWFTQADSGFANNLAALYPDAKIDAQNDSGRDVFFKSLPYRIAALKPSAADPNANTWVRWLKGGSVYSQQHSHDVFNAASSYTSEGVAPDNRLPLVDWALWLAMRPDGVARIQAMQTPQVQAQLLLNMPASIAMVLFAAMLPVIGAQPHYTPLGLKAVRGSASGLASKAGKEVSAAMQKYIPADDVRMLLAAYALLHPDVSGGSAQSTLTANQKLSPGQSLYSPLGKFSLQMQKDGNLVLYAMDPGGPALVLPSGAGTSPDDLSWQGYALGFRATPPHSGGYALWASGTNGSGLYAILQGDGNFVIYDSGNKAKWSSQTQGHSGAYITLQDDGNLVNYAPGGHAITAVGGPQIVSTYPWLSYMFDRSGVWGTTDKPGDMSHAIASQIAEALSSQGVKTKDAAAAKILSYVASDHLPLGQAAIAALAALVPKAKWTGDPYRGIAAKYILAAKPGQDPRALASHAAHQAVATARKDAAAKAAALAAQQRAAAAARATPQPSAALAKQTATKALATKIAIGGAGALALVGLIKLSLPKTLERL